VTVYVAPASRVFTQAHVPAGPVPENGEGGSLTVCGIEMHPAEVWVPIVLRPGDRVCRGCADPEGAGSEEQGALL
jgi:hypothetical protein